MNIKINGKESAIENLQVSVAEVLKANGVQAVEMVTVQLNGAFIAKEQLESTFLKENDQVDFLYFMGGGSI
jgi:sulfur carrier protein